MKNHTYKIAHRRVSNHLYWQEISRSSGFSTKSADPVAARSCSLDWWKNLNDRGTLKSSY